MVDISWNFVSKLCSVNSLKKEISTEPETEVQVASVQWVNSLFGSVFRWDQRLRSNRSTLVSAGVEFNQSAQFVIADVIGNLSAISPYFFVYLWISEKVKWFSLVKT